MIRTALRNVLAHKARLLMTVLAVLLGVSFVSGTLVLTNTISDAYTNSSQESFDHVDVQIRPVTGQGAPGSGRLLSQELLDRARALPGVNTATGSVSGFAALAGQDGTLVGEGWSTQGTNYSGRTTLATRSPRAGHRRPAARSPSTPRLPSAPATTSATPSGCP